VESIRSLVMVGQPSLEVPSPAEFCDAFKLGPTSEVAKESCLGLDRTSSLGGGQLDLKDREWTRRFRRREVSDLVVSHDRPLQKSNFKF
jgi:hypothetical protein